MVNTGPAPGCGHLGTIPLDAKLSDFQVDDEPFRRRIKSCHQMRNCKPSTSAVALVRHMSINEKTVAKLSSHTSKKSGELHNLLKNEENLVELNQHSPHFVRRRTLPLQSSCHATSLSPSHVAASQQEKASVKTTVTVLILVFINLINYMDRLTIAGMLTDVQAEFQIGDASAGLLQTAFVVAYTLGAPIFGYLGDRQSRRVLMAFGLIVWTGFTLLGSFMQTFSWFLFCRLAVGVGEASYSTLAPTIISDLFVGVQRSRMLALFYFAIPVGSGLGYVVGSQMARSTGNWRWGLRVTPFLGVLAVSLIMLVMKEPIRGFAERHELHKTKTTQDEADTDVVETMDSEDETNHGSYWDDLRYLATNRSFVWSTAAFTAVTFCTGAIGWWGPKFLEMVLALLTPPVDSDDEEAERPTLNVSLIFGAVTILSGFIGVWLGSFLSTKLSYSHEESTGAISRTWRHRADPLICSAGILVSAVFLLSAMFYVNPVSVGQDLPAIGSTMVVLYILIFIGELALNLNWSIVADILLYVVIPCRRSTAEAVQILISHAFGDAGSPYLIGVISDCLRSSAGVDSVAVKYDSLRKALLLNTSVQLLGCVCFLMTAKYVISDRIKCYATTVKGKQRPTPPEETVTCSNDNVHLPVGPNKGYDQSVDDKCVDSWLSLPAVVKFGGPGTVSSNFSTSSSSSNVTSRDSSAFSSRTASIERADVIVC